MASRHARLLRGLAWAGLCSIACTLTQDDYEPNEVSSLESAPDGSASNVAAAAGSTCTNAAGCCASASDCSDSRACVNGVCSSTCTGGEDLSTCAVPLCPGPSCPSGASNCTNGIVDGREPAVDCGDSCPNRCLNGSACNVDRDCESLLCVGSRCQAPSCSDGVQNQDEPAIDCGGSCTTSCAAGAPCRRDSDCESGSFCPPSTQLCTDGSCQDGLRTGDEVLADCGGGACPGCPSGSPCNDARDCASRVCSGGLCREATCADGLPSGDESGVDCGGSDPACTRCADGVACTSGADCASGACEDSRCISCSDGRRSGSETGPDCGGPSPDCTRCDDGAGCSIDDDCASGDCQVGTCGAVSCDDGDRNGSETDIDWGGAPECPRCATGLACSIDDDCSSQRCEGSRCTSCTDGLRNGGETDTDCGGADTDCGRCAPGGLCQADADCQSGVCDGGRCCGGSQSDCTRCAERLSASLDCDSPGGGQDSTGVENCAAFLGCLVSNAARCPTRNTPGCSGDDQVNDPCAHNNFGGNAGTGITRANQVLQNAGCQL